MDDYEMEESVGSNEHMDRLSELPESLILHMLSFLTMREVVATTILSKRWENLWTTIPCLNFSYNVIEGENDDLDLRDDPSIIRNFVNRALMFWKGTKLLKFVIDVEYFFDKSLASEMDLWVRFAVQNKVEELNISWNYFRENANEPVGSTEDVYMPPQCLNSCSSIKILSLYGCNLQIHGSVAWNQLKSLKMGGFSFSEDLINRILLGSPQLEEFDLRLIDSNLNMNIRSTSLKKLKIDKYRFFYEPFLGTVLRICCPNLETLQISGVAYSKCLFTNVSSLTDATLDFKRHWILPSGAGWIKLLGETARHILSTIQHVERLTLSSFSYRVLRASLETSLISPLPNVVLLKVGVCSIEPVDMVHLLGIFPNLKMLLIEDHTYHYSRDISEGNSLEFETNLSKSFMLQLKIIKICLYVVDSSMFRCIEFLLKHCSMLEKLVIRARWKVSCSKVYSLEVAERLMSLPRSSPTAKIIFDRK